MARRFVRAVVLVLLAVTTLGVVKISSAVADTVIGLCTVVANPTPVDHTMCSGEDLGLAAVGGLDLDYADLDHTTLGSASNLSSGTFVDADLTDANWFHVALQAADFAGATLDGINLGSGSDTGATFTGAHITGANLTNGVWGGTGFAGADLTGSDFTGGDFGTDSAPTDFTDAILTGTNFRGTALVPSDVTATATSPAGANVSWPRPQSETGEQPGLCHDSSGPVASGAVFPVGITHVTCEVISTVNNTFGTGSFTVVVSGTPATVPNPPTGVVGTPGDKQATITWTDPTNSGGTPILNYVVRWSSDGGSTWVSVPTVQHSLVATGLTNGMGYVFEVQAVNRTGPSDWSAASAKVTPAATASVTSPGAPTDLVARPGDTKVALSWTVPSSDGGAPITGYQVQYSSDGGTIWSNDPANPLTGTSTTVTRLTNRTAYEFRVAAVNSVGTGSFCNTAIATPAKPKPATPDHSRLSISGRAHVVKGGKDRIGATLTDTTTGRAYGGATLVLQVKSASGWHTIHAAKTGPKGHAYVTVRLTSGHTYRWHFVGNTKHAVATSPTRHVTVTKKH